MLYLQAPLAQLIIVALHGLEHTRDDLGKNWGDLRGCGTRHGGDEVHGRALLLEVGVRCEEGEDMRCKKFGDEVGLGDGDKLREGNDRALADYGARVDEEWSKDCERLG